jgi:hypothetical protein
MPQDGESRMDAADVYAHCLLRITELAAGSEAERMHFGDAWPALDDRRQERELASLIASSQESVEALIGFSQLEAASILRRHAHVTAAFRCARASAHAQYHGNRCDDLDRCRTQDGCRRSRSASTMGTSHQERQDLPKLRWLTKGNRCLLSPELN